LESQAAEQRPQLDFFGSASFEPDFADDSAQDGERPSEKSSALFAELDSIHPDEMSPREALDALYRLKQLADGEI
jgi:DNA mismatch repair protein mutS